MAELDLNILEIYRENPRKFRKKLAHEGLFCRLPIDESEDNRLEDHCRLIYFWRYVIDRALMDILENYQDTKHSKAANDWLGTHDFKLVCEYANLPPELVKRTILKLKEIKDHLSSNGTVDLYKRGFKV